MLILDMIRNFAWSAKKNRIHDVICGINLLENAQTTFPVVFQTCHDLSPLNLVKRVSLGSWLHISKKISNRLSNDDIII